MKQVVAKAGKVEVAEVPTPVCADNGILVRTEFSLISTGTESWSITSTEPIGTGKVVSDSKLAGKAYRLSKEVLRQEGLSGLRDYVDAVRNPELPLGYSSSGTVVEVGREVTDIVVGDRVACAGEARAAHAEFVFIPRNLATKVPEGVTMKEAAFSTVGAIAIHAVRTAKVQAGDAVGVLGVGLVGNLVAQVANASGCRVFCMDLRDDRLALVKGLGAEETARSDDPALDSKVLAFGDGMGFDHVFVCAATASSEPVNLAARLLRSRGQLVVVGRVGMEIERKDFYQKELRLLMTRSLGPGRYDPVYEEQGVDYPPEYVRWTLNRNMGALMRLVKAQRVDVDGLVGGEYELDAAAEAYDSLGSMARTAVLLKYPTRAERPVRPQISVGARGQVKGPINVALVGPGAFAKETMIPALRSDPSFHLAWLVSSNPVHATQLEKRYRFDRSSCDYGDVLSDKGLDLVVITSPNNLHFSMLSASMRAGKMALLEKPLCINREEFEAVKKLQAETKMPVVVGFNRRYAPMVLEMKKKMASMKGPFVLDYRVNAGFVQASRWSQDPALGGGRIVHECCHFFDLFNFLLGQAEPKVTADSAGVTGANTVARDNISVSLRYPDGSLANLQYIAVGGRSLDRERLELHAEKSSMVLDDFKELSFYGEEKRVMATGRQDKGHRTELAELAKSMRGEGSSIITTEEVFAATELTFRVDEAVRGAL